MRCGKDMPIIDGYFRLGSARGFLSITSCLIRPQDMSLAKTGRCDTAAAVMCRFREAEPDFTIETLGHANPFKAIQKICSVIWMRIATLACQSRFGIRCHHINRDNEATPFRCASPRSWLHFSARRRRRPHGHRRRPKVPAHPYSCRRLHR